MTFYILTIHFIKNGALWKNFTERFCSEEFWGLNCHTPLNMLNFSGYHGAWVRRQLELHTLVANNLEYQVLNHHSSFFGTDGDLMVKFINGSIQDFAMSINIKNSLYVVKFKCDLCGYLGFSLNSKLKLYRYNPRKTDYILFISSLFTIIRNF